MKPPPPVPPPGGDGSKVDGDAVVPRGHEHSPGENSGSGCSSSSGEGGGVFGGGAGVGSRPKRGWSLMSSSRSRGSPSAPRATLSAIRQPPTHAFSDEWFEVSIVAEFDPASPGSPGACREAGGDGFVSVRAALCPFDAGSGRPGLPVGVVVIGAEGEGGSGGGGGGEGEGGGASGG